MFTITPLTWKLLDYWYAETPSSHMGGISIVFEEGKWWPIWDCGLPGMDTLEEAQAAGQKFHENFLKKYLTEV